MKIQKHFFSLIVIILLLKTNCLAQNNIISGVTVRVWDSFGEVSTMQDSPDLSVGECFSENGDEQIFLDTAYFYPKYTSQGMISKSAMEELDDETRDLIFSNMDNSECVSVIALKSTDEENPYPIIAPTTIRFFVQESVGDNQQIERLGKDYRLCHVKEGQMREMVMLDSDEQMARFVVDALGYYAFYYNPHVYSVEFYDEYPENENVAVCIVEDLKRYDTVEFPEVPEKEGYVFTGWKQEIWRGVYRHFNYVGPQPFQAYISSFVYASWCPEDEYTPLEVTIDSEKITKGMEDGKEITITLSEGRFAENVENGWSVVGSDEVTVSGVERNGDRTVKLTLSGNSSDKYTDGEIQIEFDSDLYISYESFYDIRETHETADIQLDENGIKKAMFISDNSIVLNKQKKSSGSSTVYYTVSFDSKGGDDVTGERVKRGNTAKEPEEPMKEGYIFAGWYKDEGLTEKYDFESAVNQDITIYAAWKEDESNKIILTVGEKEAVIFGETVANDVAPMIVNDRVMLPVRFVAESLGAKVVWSAENPGEVKILKDETEIVIYIGEVNVSVNGEATTLDSPAFLENDRTYIPVRFVAENLCCNVVWDEEDKQVIITIE